MYVLSPYRLLLLFTSVYRPRRFSVGCTSSVQANTQLHADTCIARESSRGPSSLVTSRIVYVRYIALAALPLRFRADSLAVKLLAPTVPVWYYP